MTSIRANLPSALAGHGHLVKRARLAPFKRTDVIVPRRNWKHVEFGVVADGTSDVFADELHDDVASDSIVVGNLKSDVNVGTLF